MKRGAVCLLLFLPVQAIVSRRQASNSSRPALDACACSCCAASQRSTGLGCVPRGDGCRICAPGAVLQASFAALHNEVDYSRYCFAACQPLSSKEDAPCEERENFQEAQTQLLRAPKPAAAAPAAAPAAPVSASELEHTGEVAAESLAEVALLRAQRHAREAKQSAALARYAYEKLAKSREEASEAAGQAALEDVILDARKDAGEAVKIRAGWEDAARAHAAQKAVVAAAVYKKAKLRDLQVAEAWEKQATLLLKTSRQYEEYAARQEMKEKKLKQALKKLEAVEAEPTSLLGVAAPAPAPFRVEAPVLSKSPEPLPQVAQAPMAAFAPPPATASSMVEGIAQAPVAAAAPPPASATGPTLSVEPSITSAAAPAPASAVEVEGSKLESKEEGKEEKSKEEGKEESKKESKEENKEENKEETKEEKSKEEGKEESKKENKEENKEESKKESKEETKEDKSKEGKEKSKEEKSKEEGKEESKKESKEENKEESKEKKSKEEGKGKSKKDGKEKSEEKTEAKVASAAVPVAPAAPAAPAPAASPSAASIASSAIFGDAAGATPLVPFGGPQDEKSRLLQDLQVAEAQVDAGLKLAHEYELQAHAARKEAEGIRANASWYDGAEAAAAAHTLYAELPKGVIPPPLPALP